MHPFPPLSDLQFLIGRTLEQVCLGFWQFQFRFDTASIFVEGDLEHVDSEGGTHRHNTDADRLSPILVHHLLGQAVKAISVEPFCLTLAFERGGLLRIFSDLGQFECGQIYDDAGRMTVF